MDPKESACWKCGTAAGSALFCPSCKALLKPETDYFAFFGLPRKLQIVAADLQKRFYDLSRQLHPDRFTRAPEIEREHSLEATAILNDAFRTLRDPVQRAEYILKNAGLEIAEQRSKDVPPELLEEVFDLNMALEELRGGDEDARPQLEEAREKFIGLRDELDSGLQDLFARYDANEEGILPRIRAALNRRRYITNLIREADKELTHVHVSN